MHEGVVDILSPKGPLLRLVALGSIDLQWVLSWVGMVGLVGDSPLTRGEVSLVVNLCELKWLHNRGKGAHLTALGMLCSWCGCVLW